MVTCPFECGIKVDLTGLKQHNHSSSCETEPHNDSRKLSEGSLCEKVSESCGINPLRNGILNASAVQKASHQSNSESDQSTQLQSQLQVDSVATCPFECGIKVDITG